MTATIVNNVAHLYDTEGRRPYVDLGYGYPVLNFPWWRNNRPHVEYVIDGLLPARQRLLLTAAPGVGKSYLAAALAVAVTRGGTFLGHDVVRPGRVLYVDAENPEEEVSERIYEMSAGALHPDLHYARLWREENIVSSHGWYYSYIEKFKPAVVVLDTVSSLTRVNQIDPVAVRETLDTLWLPVKRVGGTLVLLHHNRKGRQGATDDVNGSTQWAGTVDLNWQLLQKRCLPEDRGPRFLLRESKSRSATSGDRLVSFVESSAGVIPTIIANAGNGTGQSRSKPSKVQEIVSRIKVFVDELGELTKAQIVELFSADASVRTINDALRKGIEGGAFRRSRPGHYASATGN